MPVDGDKIAAAASLVWPELMGKSNGLWGPNEVERAQINGEEGDNARTTPGQNAGDAKRALQAPFSFNF